MSENVGACGARSVIVTATALPPREPVTRCIGRAAARMSLGADVLDDCGQRAEASFGDRQHPALELRGPAAREVVDDPRPEERVEARIGSPGERRLPARNVAGDQLDEPACARLSGRSPQVR